MKNKYWQEFWNKLGGIEGLRKLLNDDWFPKSLGPRNTGKTHKWVRYKEKGGEKYV